jgi:hypothetical protein
MCAAAVRAISAQVAVVRQHASPTRPAQVERLRDGGGFPVGINFDRVFLTFFCEDFQAFKRLCLFWRGLHWSTSLLLLLFSHMFLSLLRLDLQQVPEIVELFL